MIFAKSLGLANKEILDRLAIRVITIAIAMDTKILANIPITNAITASLSTSIVVNAMYAFFMIHACDTLDHAHEIITGFRATVCTDPDGLQTIAVVLRTAIPSS